MTLQLPEERGGEMAVVKTMGVVVAVLVVLWLIFAVVGVLTAILKSVFVVLIVIALCYGAYHFFKKH
jgi:hypothetical protein